MSIGYTGCIGLEWNWRPKGMKQIKHDEAIDALEKQNPMEPGLDELGISARDPVITSCRNCGIELTDRM